MLLSLVVFALAVALATPTLEESGFSTKRSYIYMYEAQTVSGIPGASKIYSGLKVKANVRVEFDSAAVVIAQLTNIQLFTMNDAIRTADPTREQIDQVKLTHFYCPLIYQTLAEPFTFNYENGHVFNLKTPMSEPYWSVNMKRGVVSLFEINLERRMTPYKLSNSGLKAYEAFEMCPTGMCRTEYTIEEPSFNPEIPDNTMVVTKTRDFSNCTLRADWIKTPLMKPVCDDCTPDKNMNLVEGAQVRYTLKGNRQNFVILSAIAESHVSFLPYTADKTRISTIINQTMYLINAKDVKDVELEARTVDKVMTPRMLFTFLPEHMIDNKFPFHAQTRLPVPTDELKFANKKYIVNLLKTAAESINGPRVVDIGARFPVAAINMMRTVNETIFTEIWRDYAIPKETETEDDVVMRKVVWTCAAATGNYISGKVILESCTNKMIPSADCANLVNMLTMAAGPNSTLVEKFFEAAGQLQETEEPQLVRAIWLGIGVLTNKMVHTEKMEVTELERAINVCKMMLNHERNQNVRQELTELNNYLVNRYQEVLKLYVDMRARVAELVKTQLAKADIKSQVMAVKAAGNAGIPELIPILLEIVKDVDRPEFIRFPAVYALQRMAHMRPEWVRGDLIEAFMKTTDTSAVRIACFDVIILSNPPRAVMQMMARHIAREPDLQVASYMYSVFETLSNITDPCYRTKAQEAAIALHLASKVTPGIQYSAIRALQYFANTPNLRTGLAGVLAYMGSNSSILPQAAAAQVRAHIFGRTTSVFEVGMYTQGLGQAIDKLVGPDGILTNRKSILDILAPRNKRSVSSHDKLERMADELKITARKMPAPMGYMYMKVLGYELRYFDLQEAITRLATAGKIAVNYKETDVGSKTPLNFHELLFLGDTNVILPTEAGIPVSVQLAATAAVKVQGKCNPKVTPALFESRRQSAPITARALFELRPSAVIEVNGFMTTLPFTAGSGVGTAIRMTTKINTPIEGEVIVDLHRKKLVTAIKPPIQEEPLIEVETYPATFQHLVRYKNNQEKIIELAEGSRIFESIHTYGENELGLTFSAITKLASHYGKCPVGKIPFTGLSAMQIVLHPGPNPPEKIVFQTQIAAGTPVKSSAGSSEGVGSCDCLFGRMTWCMWSCEEQDPNESENIEPVSVVEDFPDLLSKDVSLASIKTKLQSKLGSAMTLSPFGYKWGMVSVIDASSPRVTRKVQLEALWQSVNKDHVHQCVARLTRTALPHYPEPMEIISHAMVQYPNRLIHPSMLLDPTYQIQVNKDMQFMTRFMNHRPVMAALNQTAVTILKRHLEHLAGGVKPDVLLRTMFTQLFARSNETEVRELIPIWRIVISHAEMIRTIAPQAVDPIFVIKHAPLIAAKLPQLQQVQLALIQRMQALREEAPVSLFYIPALEYLVMEHYNVLTALDKICYLAAKMDVVPNAETLWKDTKEVVKNLNEQVIQYAQVLAVNPQLPETMNPHIQKCLPTIDRLSKRQWATLVHLKQKTEEVQPPSLREVNEVVDVAKEAVPTLTMALKYVQDFHHEKPLIPILLKVANQHFMVYKSLHYLRDILGTISAINESDLSNVMEDLKNQVSTITMAAAILVKFDYELLTLKPVIAKSDLQVVKKLQKIQLAIELEAITVTKIRHGYAMPYEIPEEVFTSTAGAIEFIESVVPEVDMIIQNIQAANIEPNLSIFEKVLLTVYEIRQLAIELSNGLKVNTFFDSETGRSVQLIRQCTNVLLMCEYLELNTTQAFERVMLSASQPELTSSLPMSDTMIETATSVAIQKQTEVITELTYWTTKKPLAHASIEPSLETLIDTCRGIQGKIDWIQLWGVPMGSIAPVFAHCITQQQEILKLLREVVTIAESYIENPVPYNLAIEALQSDLARIVKIGSITYSEHPQPGIKNIPAVEINPITQRAAGYLPLAITAFCNISFGQPGRPLKTIVMKLYASKSFEQYLWESKQMSPLVRDETITRAIVSESSHLPAMAHYPVYNLLNSLNHRHLIVKFNPEDIPERARLVAHKTTVWLSAYKFWNTYISRPVSTTPGFCHIMNEARMNSPASDFFIMTPNLTISMFGVHAPLFNAMSIPVALTRPPMQRRLQLAPYTGPYLPATCKAMYTDIRTFDGVKYSLRNIGSCDAVLAMDCSPAKTFAITVRSSITDMSRKILTIVAENKVIEIAATATGATLTVDGSAVTVTPAKPFILEKPVKYGEAAVCAKIAKDTLYRIDLPMLGIYISTDGNLVEIKASPVFKMRTCGLCSNMDGQQRNEFEAPDTRVFYSPEQFISSYIIGGPNCPSRAHQDPFTAPQVLNAAEDRCARPTEQILIKIRKLPKNPQRQLCFSVRPVRRCREGCRGLKNATQKVEVDFKCLPENRESKQIRKQINEGKPVDIRKIRAAEEIRLSVSERSRCRHA